MKHPMKVILRRLYSDPIELSQRTDLTQDEATEILQVDGSHLSGRLHHRALRMLCITDVDEEATAWTSAPVKFPPQHVQRGLNTFTEAKDYADRGMKSGRPLDARDGAVAMAELAKTPKERGIAYNAAGGVHRMLGNLEAARRNYEASWRLLSGDEVWGLTLKNNRALIDIRLGLIDTAEFHIEGVLSDPKAKSYRRAWAWMNRGEIAILKRDWAAADVAFRTASELFATAHANRRATHPKSPETSPEQYFSLIHLAFAQASMGVPGAAEQLARWCSEPEVAAEDPESATLAKILYGALTQDSGLLIAARDQAHEARLFELENAAANYLRVLLSAVALLLCVAALTPSSALAASPAPQKAATLGSQPVLVVRDEGISAPAQYNTPTQAAQASSMRPVQQSGRVALSKHDTGDDDFITKPTFVQHGPHPWEVCSLDALMESMLSGGPSMSSWLTTCWALGGGPLK